MSEEKNTLGSDAHRLVGASHPHTSHIAARELDSVFSEGLVLECIRKKYDTGAIQDDIQSEMERRQEAGEDWIRIDSVSARFMALLEKCYIRRGPQTRKGYRSKGSKQQLVMYALSDQERLERLAKIKDIASTSIVTSEQYQTIMKWYQADAALKKAQEEEQLAREIVHDIVFLNIQSGIVTVPIDFEGYKLRAKIAEGVLRNLKVKGPRKKCESQS